MSSHQQSDHGLADQLAEQDEAETGKHDASRDAPQGFVNCR